MRFLIVLLALFSFATVTSQTVRIGLFNDQNVKSLAIAQISGKYKLQADSSLQMELRTDDVLYISLFDDKLLLRNLQGPIGCFSNIRISSLQASVLRIALVNPSGIVRQYCDDVSLKVAFGRILVVNEAALDNYLAGVVDSETGPNAEPELYKAQSVLARTFVYGHFDRHSTEGFDLCDGVHCQAYKGRSMRNPAIFAATVATRGKVVLASDSTFITAVFHANCGGETESSYNAWVSGKSYLVSVKDPFCQNSPAAQWTKKIPLDQWKKYLTAHGFKLVNKTPVIGFDYAQIHRLQQYKIKKDSMPLKQIRSDFQLRSTYFSIVADNKEVTLKGKGYGHGVGLCQEGAIQMAKIGYKYEDILNFYYKGIRIADVESVKK